MMLNKEKQDVLEHDGNTLVIANPGTGKTLLLAYKYVNLIKKGSKADEILCLTFTNKARKEMEDRILKILKDEKITIDLATLKVYTFHSYALETIGKENTISSNFLRYSVYRYFKDNEILNYGEDYLLESIVPKMENLIRYVKSFGIAPEEINLEEVKKELTDFKTLSKAEMDKFAEDFVAVYHHYEETKKGKGIDYVDMLLEFTKLKRKPKFKHVLVDELQDVNKIEADIALESGETYFAVGDKKQAIFGFQGGSIVNFEKFKKAKIFVLSENFRSTNEILNYCKEHFVSKTKDSGHKEDLKDLRNEEAAPGAKPKIFSVGKEDTLKVVCEAVREICKTSKNVAVIARTNLQIMRLSKELQNRGIEHSSTYFSASRDARTHSINFIRGVLSKDANDVKNAMFTPFFPISLQDAFELSELDEKELTIEAIFKKSPSFRELRESVKTIEDVNTLFKTRIIPVSVAYGKEYLLSSLALQDAFAEAMKVMEEINLGNLMVYLKASDLLADESNIEKQVILTTVHKAKGKQFESVVYVPHQSRDTTNFQDEVVKAILRTKGINAEQELAEETLRIDFVALTRAKKELFVFPEKLENYLNSYCEKSEMMCEGVECFDTSEKMRRAYSLFVNGDAEKSKKLLEDKKPWVRNFIKKHFESLDYVSYSSLTTDPCEYLSSNILGISEYSGALSTGSEAHAIAEAVFRGDNYEVPKGLEKYEANIKELFGMIEKDYPERVSAEHKLKLPMESLTGTGKGVMFKGFIDAIFKNKDDYLIFDWKTDKNDDRGSQHRQQLEAYRRAYSLSTGIPLEKIKVAIGYIGLRTTVNLGKIGCKLDDAQPRKSTFETFTKYVNALLAWKENPDLFFEALIKKSDEDLICKAVVEQYKLEI